MYVPLQHKAQACTITFLATKALLPTRYTDSSWDATSLTPRLRCRTGQVCIQGPVTSSMHVMA